MKTIDILLTGFLSAVGLAPNPFASKLKEIRSLSNAQKLDNDFRKVAEDFRKVYEREAEQNCKAAE